MTHTLIRYTTREPLRPATYEERCRSREAARLDGGRGVILVGIHSCCVEDGSGYADPVCEEKAWEAYDEACASWGERCAEAGSGHYMATRNACDANLLGQQAAGSVPCHADYGITPYVLPPTPVPNHDDDLPF